MFSFGAFVKIPHKNKKIKFVFKNSGFENNSGSPEISGHLVALLRTYEIGSMTDILGQLKYLKWESLKKRRKDNRLKLLYKYLKSTDI